MARKLVVEIVGDTSKLEGAFKRGRRESEQFGKSIGRLRVGLGTLAKSVVVVEAIDKAIEGLTATIHAGIEEVSQRAKVGAQLDAALKSTGNQAHVTVKHLDDMALSLSNLSGVDDEVVKSGEATLLMFRNVQNYAGKGNKIFDRATLASLNFSVKTGKSMDLASRSIGKALADPSKAASSLRRAFVILSDDEKKAIDTAVKHGDTLKAQRLILDAVDKRYAGQAKALGDTLPGMINIARERFKDLAGDIGDKITPALKNAAKGVTDFIKRLSEAKGTRAKLDVVVEGAEDLGRKIFDLVRGAVQSAADKLRSIDYRGIADAIRDKLASIDWLGLLRSAAQTLSHALITVLNFVTDLRDRIDWQKVGKYIVDGIGAAVAAAIVFLKNVDWVGLIKALIRFQLSALKQMANLSLGIGKEIARLLWEGLKAGMNWLGQKVFELTTRVVLKLIEPFSHIPWKGGQWARDLKVKLQTALDNVGQSGHTKAFQIGASIGAGMAEGIAAGASAVGAAAGKLADAAVKGGKGAGPDKPPPPPGGDGGAAAAGGLSAFQQKRLDRLSFNVEKAGATKTVKDDLAALRVLQAYLRQLLSTHKHNLDIERQIFDTQQQMNTIVGDQEQAAADAAAKRREAAKRRREAAIARAQKAQFAHLGLGPGGEDLVPGIGALKKQLASLRKNLGAAGLLAPHLHMIEQIGKVLAGKWGKAGAAVRQKIAEIFGSWRDELKGQGDQTKRTTDQFASVSTDALVRGLGLDPKTAERLRVRIAGLGRGMTRPAGTSRQFVGGRALTVNGNVNVYNTHDIGALENQLTKRQASRAHNRRGAR